MLAFHNSSGGESALGALLADFMGPENASVDGLMAGSLNTMQGVGLFD